MEKTRINYSTTVEVRRYLEELSCRYNMGVSAVITMLIMQHKMNDDNAKNLSNVQNLIDQLMKIQAQNIK